MRKISEAETRKMMIDPALERAGWNLKNHAQVGLEIPVDGYDKEPWNGVTDYCLYRPNGEVIAVVEAKRTSHDPRLQKSQAEAEKALFFEYLERYPTRPTYGPDARKYDLAHAVWDYVTELAGRRIPLDQLFVTNLCNEFSPSSQGGGTVLIPEKVAELGVEAIRDIVLIRQLFHHRGIPLVPIVHVKQWPLKAHTIRYTGPMELANHEVRKALAIN